MIFQEMVSSQNLLVMIVVCVVIAVLSLIYTLRKPRLPPQPGLPLPIIGHLHKLKADPREQFKVWRKQFGDIFSLYIGSELLVVLNGYDVINEALVKRGNVFSHRPLQYFDTVSGLTHRGIICCSGAYWKEQKNVVMSILRKSGFTSNSMPEKATEEAVYLADAIAEGCGQEPINIKPYIRAGIFNLLFIAFVGTRLPYDDEDVPRMGDMIDKLFDSIVETNAITTFPALRHVPGDLFHGKEMEKVIKETIQLVFSKMESIDKTRQEKEDKETPLSVLQVYRQEMGRKRKRGEDTFLDDDSLKRLSFDFVAAGTETTIATIEWLLLFLLHNPDVQENMAAEIKKEIGASRAPSLEDRSKLIYVRAVIMEAQRLGNIAPLSLPHSTSSDTEFRGYHLPKETLVFPNIESILLDCEVWGQDADSFRPSRFLDACGQLIHREEWVPYGLGRRSCPGAPWANMELFLFTATLCQRFEFKPKDPNKLPSLEPVFRLGRKPPPFELIVLKR